MATNGSAYEGLDNIVAAAVYTGLDLRLYTNTADSLTKSTVLADLTYTSGTGYATLSLSGTWSASDGVVTYSHPGNPSFTNTSGGNWTGNVVGAAITDGTYLLHWKDFASGAFTVVDTQTVAVDISTLAA
jgi:hypothetical protein